MSSIKPRKAVYIGNFKTTQAILEYETSKAQSQLDLIETEFEGTQKQLKKNPRYMLYRVYLDQLYSSESIPF